MGLAVPVTSPEDRSQMGRANFLAETFGGSQVDHMRSGNTAKALRQYNIGTAVNHAKGLEGSCICGHGSPDIVIANFSNHGPSCSQIVPLLRLLLMTSILGCRCQILLIFKPLSACI